MYLQFNTDAVSVTFPQYKRRVQELIDLQLLNRIDLLRSVRIVKDGVNYRRVIPQNAVKLSYGYVFTDENRSVVPPVCRQIHAIVQM